MKNLKLTSENAFLGAKVSKGKEVFYVVKINEKTIYASNDEDFLSFWEHKGKGITWKNFCEGHGGKSYKYEGFTINKEESEKKQKVEAQEEIQKTQKNYLKGQVKAKVQEAWKRFLIKKAKGKGKSYTGPIEGGDVRVNVVSGSVEAKAFLLNISGKYVFYFVEDDVYTLFSYDDHKLGKDIVWPVSPLED